jgi:hypothetical protein
MNPVDERTSGARSSAAMEPLSGMDALARALRSLPGVGPKAAQRMALHLLQHDRDGAAACACAPARRTTVRHCDRCNNWAKMCYARFAGRANAIRRSSASSKPRPTL